MHRRQRGFTLVELLVVIGIIAVLLGILLPTLGRMREAGNQVSCLSNLRQIAIALHAYVQDYDGVFPIASDSTPDPADWIYWQPDRDPAKSALASYLGDSFNPKIYTCPSDDPSSHPGPVVYPFSYTLNARIGGARDTPTTWKPLFPPTRANQIVHSSEKILMIDESSEGIDDGAWAPTTLNPEEGHSHNMLSNRHDKRSETIRNAAAGKGNAIFADSHGDFIDRSWCLMERYVDPRY